MTVSTPAPVQDVYAKWEQDFKATEVNHRSNKINLIAKIALCALIAAVLAAGVVIAFMAAPITVPLGIVLVTVAVAISILPFVFLIQNPHLAYMQTRDQLQDYSFRDLIQLDDDKYTERKVDLFKKYGAHCKKLDLRTGLKSQIGIPVKAFLEWRLENTYQYGKPYHQKTVDFLKSINTSNNIHKGVSDLSIKINAVIHNLNIEYEYLEDLETYLLEPNETQANRDKKIIDAKIEIQNLEKEIFKNLTESSDSITKPQDIADIIRACPNVETLDLNLFHDFTEVQKACQAIGVKPKELDPILANYSIKRDFQNIKI